MSKLKWITKQYWRIGTIRAILSLGMGMFTLGKLYVDYVPGLSDFGLRGALLLGFGLFLFFLGLGWLYDVKAKMWSQALLVNIERDPFRYVPNYKTLAVEYPFLFAIVTTLNKTFQKIGMHSNALDDLRRYFDFYFKRRPNRRDILAVENASRNFLQVYPFHSDSSYRKNVELSAKLKKGFETQKLRISWIQALTGMAQDTLVFGALYITILIPDPNVDATLKTLYGVLFLSLPLYTLFVIAGWYYDKKLKAWTADIVVKIERNPYTYVPEPRTFTFVFPFFLPVLLTFREVLAKIGEDTTAIDRQIDYLREYGTLGITYHADMKRARELRRSLGPLFKNISEVQP